MEADASAGPAEFTSGEALREPGAIAVVDTVGLVDVAQDSHPARTSSRPLVIYYVMLLVVVQAGLAGVVAWTLTLPFWEPPTLSGTLVGFVAFLVVTAVGVVFAVGLWRGHRWGYWSSLLVVGAVAGGFGFGTLTFVMEGPPWDWIVDPGYLLWNGTVLLNVLAVVALGTRGVRAWCNFPTIRLSRG